MPKYEWPRTVRANFSDPLVEHPETKVPGRGTEEMKTTEVTGRIAARLNDVNRDLVIIARLETSQQQIFSEWNQLVGKISSGRAIAESDAAKPVVIGASVNPSDRTRVSFRQ